MSGPPGHSRVRAARTRSPVRPDKISGRTHRPRHTVRQVTAPFGSTFRRRWLLQRRHGTARSSASGIQPPRHPCATGNTTAGDSTDRPRSRLRSASSKSPSAITGATRRLQKDGQTIPLTRCQRWGSCECIRDVRLELRCGQLPAGVSHTLRTAIPRRIAYSGSRPHDSFIETQKSS